MDKKALLILAGFLMVMVARQANAQFWQKKVQQTRLPLISQTNFSHVNFIPATSPASNWVMPHVSFPRTRYNYDLEEAAIMKDLYHTLRFRMYGDAITSMNKLVNIYIDESRYSEAKWYLLQCNYFGHKSNNTAAVINSLVSLGLLKAEIGEYDQARQDLLDAQTICFEQSMAIQAADIDKKLKLVEAKRFANVKNEIQYAEVFDYKKGTP